MKTCLKLYHHSTFNDGKYPPRRINVELTAGGGGKSDHRKSKIEAKNQRLEEQRQRSAKEIQREKRKNFDNGPQENGGADHDPNDAFAGIHPSRRNQLR
ncbi:hypothetical protein AWENTII_012349 [Aspergillus wentii]